MIKKTMLSIFLVFVLSIIPIAMAAIPTFSSIRTTDAEFQMLSQDPDPAFSGSNVELRFKIENIGSADINNLIFDLILEHPFSLEPGDDGQRYLGTVNAYQVGQNAFVLYYKLKVEPTAISGDYRASLRYSTDDGLQWVRFDEFTIRVESQDPILAVKSISSVPSTVGPGDTVNLDIELENVADTFIKNVRVNLKLFESVQTTTGISIEEKPFSPVGSSNEKIIKIMTAGEEKIVSFKLIADADAEPKSYKFPLILTYIDDKGVETTKEHIISLNIGKEPDLMYLIDNVDPFISGKTDTLTVRFVNKGVSDIKFLSTELSETQDYEIMSSEKVYVGNIDSDDYETADFKIETKEIDNDKIKMILKVEFLDSNNNKYRKDIVLEHKVYSENEAIKAGLIQKSNKLGIIVVIVIVVVGFFTYRYISKRRKKRN